MRRWRADSDNAETLSGRSARAAFLHNDYQRHEQRCRYMDRRWDGLSAARVPSRRGRPSADLCGQRAANGNDGHNGLSAYDVWQETNPNGTPEQFVASLVGHQGDQGIPGINGSTGRDGLTGQGGKDAYALWLALTHRQRESLSVVLASALVSPLGSSANA